MPLGRGLESLIPIKKTAAKTAANTVSSENIDQQANIITADILAIKVNPQQPRKQFTHQALEELISSIKQYGILQPLLVCQKDNAYQLIAGERRWRAAKIAGLTSVPVIVRSATEVEQLEIALIENIQRADLNPIEKAVGYNKLLSEFGLSQEAAAKKIGISRSAFANIVRLLNLPGVIQSALADGSISEGHAKLLLSIPQGFEQLKQFKHIVEDKLSVRALENLLNNRITKTKTRKKTVLEPHIKAWEDALALKLATKVTISSIGERGTITIHYFSPAELAALVKKITFN